MNLDKKYLQKASSMDSLSEKRQLVQEQSTRPNFLGIGSVRGGSTWLHNILDSHPSILLPQRRKEVQYFTKYFDKGKFWYCSFFKNTSLNGIKYIGEVTPGYLTHSDAPKRISELGVLINLY